MDISSSDSFQEDIAVFTKEVRHNPLYLVKQLREEVSITFFKTSLKFQVQGSFNMILYNEMFNFILFCAYYVDMQLVTYSSFQKIVL